HLLIELLEIAANIVQRRVEVLLIVGQRGEETLALLGGYGDAAADVGEALILEVSFDALANAFQAGKVLAFDQSPTSIGRQVLRRKLVLDCGQIGFAADLDRAAPH